LHNRTENGSSGSSASLGRAHLAAWSRTPCRKPATSRWWREPRAARRSRPRGSARGRPRRVCSSQQGCKATRPRGDRGHDDDEMTSRCAGCLECLRTYVWPQHEVKCICGSERCMCVYVGTGAMSRDGGFHAVRAACEIIQIRSLLQTKVFYIFVNFKTFLTIW
jgi:hypothetical protein